MDVRTLKRIRQKEKGSKANLSELPVKYYEDCLESLDAAFKDGDYSNFKDMLILIKSINEIRQGKILKFAVYRSTPKRMIEANPVANILHEEETLLEDFLSCIERYNDKLDLKLNGYYFQEVHND